MRLKGDDDDGREKIAMRANRRFWLKASGCLAALSVLLLGSMGQGAHAEERASAYVSSSVNQEWHGAPSHYNVVPAVARERPYHSLSTTSYGDDPDVDNAAAGLGVLILLGLFVGVPLYFIPAIVALCRDHEYKVVIVVVNVFCGWTGIVWIAILAWSVWPRNTTQNFPPYYAPPFPNKSGGSPPPFPASHDTPAHPPEDSGPSVDQLEKLEKIGKMKQEGILSDAEFEVAKARILRTR